MNCGLSLPAAGPAISPASKGIPCQTLAYPEDEIAEALLSTLARHPKPDEYGITEILAGDPADPYASPVPALAGAPRHSLGDGPSVFPASFGLASYYGLAGVRWQNSAIRFYRLNAHACGDQRFTELVNRETESSEQSAP